MEAKAQLDEIAHLNVAGVQIGHSKGAGELDVLFILSHKDKLSHFYIHDGREHPPKDHLALGDGEIDLIERRKTIQEGVEIRKVNANKRR